MPRPRKCRRVGFVPQNQCFHPQLTSNEEVVLSIEELEAVRLSDFQCLDQDASAESMEVSRGTFQRIIHEAHYKIADALVHGKMIRIEGGSYELIKEPFCCHEQSRSCRGRRCEKENQCHKGGKKI